jgi:hypothetical protein
MNDGYFLHVDLVVPESRTKHFEKRTREFLDRGGFQYLVPSVRYHLVLALKSTEPFAYTAQGRFGPRSRIARTKSRSVENVCFDARVKDGEPVFRYVHLWHAPDLRDLDLARLMESAADDGLYREIDAYVVQETQNFVRRVRWLSGLPRFTLHTNRFTRVIKTFASKDLAVYLFKIGALFPQLDQNGWRQLGQFQSVTGSLNSVIEFWQTGDKTSVQAMVDACDSLHGNLKRKLLDGGAGVVHLPVAEVREAFERPSYFPLDFQSVHERKLPHDPAIA